MQIVNPLMGPWILLQLRYRIEMTEADRGRLKS